MAKSQNRTLFGFLFFCAIVTGTVISISFPQLFTDWAYAQQRDVAVDAQREIASAKDLSSAFKAVAKRMRPSVVSITSKFERRTSNQNPFGGQQIPERFRDFFNDEFFGRLPQSPGQRPQPEGVGSGTGFIVSGDGYILTNNHVVSGATSITVTLSTSRELEAQVVGSDKATDLAVLKVQASDLLPAKLGSSDAMEVGDWVLAIGSPFGLDQTVTAGIISAKGRSRVGITDYEDFIQTDAAINPGNSGGPLVNLNGEVIGINTAIASKTGSYMGIGFSIPSDMAKFIKDSIIKSGTVERGYLGVLIQDLDENLADSFGYSSTEGALVGQVVESGPGAMAGLKEGDIITHLGEIKILTMPQLRNTVAATVPGTELQLKVFRDGKTIDVVVTVGKLDAEAVAASTQVDNMTDEVLGITVESLTPDKSKKLGYSADLKGVLVAGVKERSLAAQVGVQPSDIILQIGNTKVKTASEFTKVMSESDVKQGIRIHILRGGVTRFLFIRT